MSYKHILLFYQNITPLHVGCGQDVGVVDNPIIRERSTGFPFVPGSGIRGVLRDRFENALATDANAHQQLFWALFGPEPAAGESSEHAGCLSVHDAKILLFPLRSDKNIFYWITCPFVLQRFNRDIEAFGGSAASFANPEQLFPAENHYIALESAPAQLMLEEFPFKKADSPTAGQSGSKEESEAENPPSPASALSAWATGNNFESPERIVIVADQVFDYFVRNATIIIQHNRLTSAKTVAEGALFSVESLPPETIFYGLIGGTKARNNHSEITSGEAALTKLFEQLRGSNSANEAHINLGGDESTGLGVTRITW